MSVTPENIEQKIDEIRDAEEQSSVTNTDIADILEYVSTALKKSGVPDDDIKSIDTLGRNWEGIPIRIHLKSGAVLSAPLNSVYLDPANPGNDLAGLISPTQARQIAANAERINELKQAEHKNSANIDYLLYENNVHAMGIDEANRAAEMALEGVQAAEDAARDAKSSAKEAKNSAKEAEQTALRHRADVGVYPIKGVARWRYDGMAGTVEGETYLRDRDSFLTVTVAYPDREEPLCQSTGDFTYCAEGVDPAECGRNLLLDTNKHLGRWICRTGDRGGNAPAVDHLQTSGSIADERYDLTRWPGLKPSQGDLTRFTRASLATDPALTWELLYYPLRADTIVAGKSYVLQFTTYGNDALTFEACFAKLTGADALCPSAEGVVETLPNGARRHTFTLTAEASGADDPEGVYYVYIPIVGGKGSWTAFEVWDLKLEEAPEAAEGDTPLATAWTKAPEDSTPWLKAEVKRRNDPYNYNYRPMGDRIYRLGSTLYRHDDGGLVEMGGSVSEALINSLGSKQGRLRDSEDITVNDNKLLLTERAKHESLIAEFKAAGGGFDEDTQLGSLNGLTDLSYEDMAVILEAGRLTYSNCESFYANNNKLRTNLAPVYGWNPTSLPHTAWACPALEVFNALRCTLGAASFSGCVNLHTIVNPLNVDSALNSNCFLRCAKLKSLQLKLLAKAVSFSLADSPLVDLASFQYMVTNAVNTAAITVTVHPDVYAMLTGDTTNAAAAALSAEEAAQWQALVGAALAKNIAFATN